MFEVMTACMNISNIGPSSCQGVCGDQREPTI